MNREAQAMHKKKRKGWKQYHENNSDADHIVTWQVKNELSQLTHQLCKGLEKDLARNVKYDPKLSKLKNKPRIGNIKANFCTACQSVLVKADILNTYFASLFTAENVEDMSSLETKYHGTHALM